MSYVHLGSRTWNKTHQNMDQRIKSGEKSAPFYLSRVTCWCWYVWTELSTLLLCAELCRLRSLWPHCFVDSSWREKEVLEVWRKACLGSFLKVIRCFVQFYLTTSYDQPFSSIFFDALSCQFTKNSSLRALACERVQFRNNWVEKQRAFETSFSCKKTCKSSTVGFEIFVHLVAQPRPSMPWNCVKLRFFLGTEDCTVFCWSEMWKKDTRERNSTMSLLLFASSSVEVTIMGGDRGGKALNSSWSPSIFCAVHLKILKRCYGCCAVFLPVRAGKWRLWKGRPGAGWWPDAVFLQL